MNRVLSCVFALIAVVVINGCSTAKVKPLDVPKNDATSKIIVFRPSVPAAVFNDMFVSIDGKEIAVLKSEQFVTAVVAPGAHVISVRGKTGRAAELTLDALADTTLYVEAAGSASNVINFIPGTDAIKSNFYIEPAESFEPEADWKEVSAR